MEGLKQDNQEVSFLKTESPSENSEEILTEEEIEAALKVARFQKQARLNEDAYRKKLAEEPQYFRTNAKQMLDIVLQRGKDIVGDHFVLDEDNLKIYQLLSLYFTGDPLFEEQGYSLKKGIMLHGNIGCGKTKAMELFAFNPVQGYGKIDCRTISKQFASTDKEDGGYKAIEKYSGMINSYRPDLHYGQKKLGWFFDDLGTEGAAKNFGNEVLAMQEIIQNRYENHEVPGNATHITTNLSADQIEEVYGARVRSRMREMFNIIPFPQTAKDRRK